MKKTTIVRRSLDEVLELRRCGYSGIDAERVETMTPEEIERLADEDDERLGIDTEQWGEGYKVRAIPDGSGETSTESVPFRRARTEGSEDA